MKRLFIISFLTLSQLTFALVSFGPTSLISNVATNRCERYVKISFVVNWQINNNKFKIWRATEPNFFSSILVGTITGCGTCDSKTYSIEDYNLQPGITYYYKIVAISNWDLEQKKYIGSIYTPIPIDFINQVTDDVNIGSSPINESAYSWNYENNKKQGIVISLYPTEVYNIYAEQNNFELIFKTTELSQFVQIKISINNSSYFNIYNGSQKYMFDWINAKNYFPNNGIYTLKVKFLEWSGKYYERQYNIVIVPQSDELHIDNYCNTIRVWRGYAGPSGFDGLPIVLSEGFDPYNTKSQQYYRYTGKNLIECLLKKGFNVYIIDYSFNAQSIEQNASVFSSAIRYINSLTNKKVIAAGISMGGIINRLACALAEQNNNPLPISKFITIDSPHQGAVVSKDLQDWRKIKTSGDNFADYAINNPAAKQMLIYNPYDNGSTHSLFYNYLKNINGDGYPHLVEKIGVSFSNSTPNPYSKGTKWLELTIKTNINNKEYQSFYLSDDEIQAGSYFPKFNIDPSQIYLISTKQWSLSPLQSFIDPYIVFNQIAYPTFIPHNSSLDIINNISPFDKTIVPLATYFHDEVPEELLDAMLNSLISTNTFIQGKVYLFTTKDIIASSGIYVGDSVTSDIPYIGTVRIINSDITLKAGNEIVLNDEVWIEEGSNFSASISNPVTQCDNSIEQQVMKIQIDSTTQLSVINTDSNQINNINSSNIINLYPNPASTHLHIISSEEDWYDLSKIEMVNALGQVFELPKESIQNISGFTEGIYFIKFYFNSGTIVVKSLIIQKE